MADITLGAAVASLKVRVAAGYDNVFGVQLTNATGGVIDEDELVLRLVVDDSVFTGVLDAGTYTFTIPAEQSTGLVGHQAVLYAVDSEEQSIALARGRVVP